MENLYLIAALAGVTELYKRLVDSDYKAAGLIAVAAVAGGALAPYAGDLTWFVGMLYGFSAAGVITTASYVGNK